MDDLPNEHIETLNLLHQAFNRLAPSGKEQAAFSAELKAARAGNTPIRAGVTYAINSLVDGMLYGNWPYIK